MFSMDLHTPCCAHRQARPSLAVVKACKPPGSHARKAVDSRSVHAGPRKRQCRRTRTLCRAVHPADDSRDEPVDIDQLAKRLGQEAEKVRQQELDQPSTSAAGTDDLAASFAEAVRQTEDRAQATVESTTSPFGFESDAREAAVLEEVGEGGFEAQEFELIEQIGQLSWVTEMQSDEAVSLGRQPTAQQTAIIAFAARYHSNLPFQDAQPTMLKEYLPGARSLGCNELQLLNHLCSMPAQKWKAAYAALSANPPIVPLLGYFMAGQSEVGAKVSNSKSPPGGALWLVYKWESLRPLSEYFYAQQSAGGGLFGTNEEAALRSRCRMIRSMMRGTLSALAFCHNRSVAHGSMGSGSILVSTYDDRRANDLIVKLDNFGFGRAHYACSLDLKGDDDRCEQQTSLFPGPRPLDDEHPLVLAQKEDLQALCGVFLELVFSSLGEEGPTEASSAPALQRLMTDVFKGDIDEFRKYCSQDPNWTDPLLLLEQWDGAGWQLIRSLAAGNVAAIELMKNKFCQV